MTEPDAALRFGTAGLRGPMRPGPGGMNVEAVVRATAGLAAVLTARGHAGATVVVGRDARHHSAQFATAAAEVLAAAGFAVRAFPEPVPTPVVAFTVRDLGAAAGVQITASHNPGTDNGYKVYLDGGLQLVSPADREIEAAMTAVTGEVPRVPVAAASGWADDALARYLARAAAVRRASGDVRVALTAMHGVGGRPALAALRAAGITDVHVVAEQFDPDPDFPTVAFPNPEEPGATDLLLAEAERAGAEVAVALDPDADRCAVGIPTDDGWRMLSGDETGWLLGDYLLSTLHPEDAAAALVASTVVSSRLLAKIAAAYGARHAETLTGFKWLARADAERPGLTLRYAYEEAIGHCVDPVAVRDKDGISAAVLACDLVAALRSRSHSGVGRLDDLARVHGVHATTAVSARTDAAAAMSALRACAPAALGGVTVTATDLLSAPADRRTDALVLTGGPLRVVVRPSGTEPKVKAYLEVALPAGGDVAAGRARAADLLSAAGAEIAKLLQRGPN